MAAASSRSLPNLASVELDEITWTNEVIKAHKQQCLDRESKYLECQKYSFYQCLFFSSIETIDLEERIASIESIIGDIVPPLQQASIQYNGEATEDDYTNPKSIWFKDFGNRQDKQRFITKLTNESLKRNMNTNSSLS